MISSDPLWYKDAIIYQLHIKAFFDSNDDGVGDFAGLDQKLDYLSDLGVTAVWLLPFYPSPLRDDGYDISDYRNVNPAYGTVPDFRRFVRSAHDRGIRVITELVVNHTSDQHPWFQRARHAKPGSSDRDFYVWSNTNQKYLGTRIIFTDTEISNWAWDPEANAYYWHRFFSHQPDLNFENPRVLKALQGAMRFWFEMGVDGMRLDAVPYLCEREGTNNENLDETHSVVRKLRGWLDEHYQDKMFLGEANQWPEDVRPYFGEGNECHMAFHFPLMPRIYMAVAQEDRHPITDIMRQTPDIPETCQWAVFLRNHDELTLEMVTDSERDYLWQFYAADRQARINLGIRRRLAPLLENNRRKIELLNSLLMSMPGTPIVYYGDEIGMGDNIFLGDRNGVRTPMQWGPDRNGGFSRADPARLYLPAIMDPVYGYGAVNVEAQQKSPSSLLNWMKRLIAVRKAHIAFGRGSLRFLYPGNRKVLAYLREYDGEVIFCIANLSRAAQPVELDLGEYRGRIPVELLGRSVFPPIGELPYFITLQGHSFYWFLLTEEAEVPHWHEELPPLPPDLETLVLPRGMTNLLDDQPRRALEGRLLRDFLKGQRWFAAKGETVGAVSLRENARVGRDGGSCLLSLCTAAAGGDVQTYFMPLAIGWEKDIADHLAGLLPFAISKVRRGSAIGWLFDGMVDSGLTLALINAIRKGTEVATDQDGRIVFEATSRFPDLGDEPLDVQRLGAEQSNTSVRIGDEMILKIYRKLQSGIHPELEINWHLTEVAGFANIPALLGTIRHVAADGTETALGILQEYVSNQGDGWRFTLNYLGRFIDEALVVTPGSMTDNGEQRHQGFFAQMAMLGRRTAEMHVAFATRTRDSAFNPQRVRPSDLKRWSNRVRRQAQEAFSVLRRTRRRLPAGQRETVDAILANRKQILERVMALVPDNLDAKKTRYHGDYHLGQVVVVHDDFHILDFEGEPARSLADRRDKSSPLIDVAGMLRSFDYAARTALNDMIPEDSDRREDLTELIEDWSHQCRAHFLDGYRHSAADCPSVPSDPAAFDRLLSLFVFGKLFYEICYEASNRPEWLSIPLQALGDLLDELKESD